MKLCPKANKYLDKRKEQNEDSPTCKHEIADTMESQTPSTNKTSSRLARKALHNSVSQRTFPSVQRIIYKTLRVIVRKTSCHTMHSDWPCHHCRLHHFWHNGLRAIASDVQKTHATGQHRICGITAVSEQIKPISDKHPS